MPTANTRSDNAERRVAEIEQIFGKSLPRERARLVERVIEEALAERELDVRRECSAQPCVK
jgi:hypothetical protein